MNAPYTYLIGWPNVNRWYYGVRYAKNCDPKDLWITYFTSSDIVKQFRVEHGEPSVIIIRKIFTNKDRIIKAREWETRVLKRLKVRHNPIWLNVTDSNAPPINRKFGDDNIMRSSKQRERMRNNNPFSRPEVIKKIQETRKMTGPYKTRSGIKQTEETKQLLKQRWADRKTAGWIAPPRTPEMYIGVSQKLKGGHMSDEAKEKARVTKQKNGYNKGANNPAAKPLLFRGTQYSYIKEASIKTGLSVYKILKECQFIRESKGKSIK